MFRTLRQVARSLARRPQFSLLAIFIMALCIGGNASTFSAAKAVLFQKLIYRDVDRLVVFHLVDLPSAEDNDVSWVEVGEWRERSKTMRDLSPFIAWQDRTLIAGDTAERIGVNFCAPSYLQLLGVQPQLGRLFSQGEEGAPGGAPVLILSHELWQRQFARDPGIVGRKVQLNGKPYTILGVMPRGFVDPIQGHYKVEAWLPAVQAVDTFSHRARLFELRDDRYWSVLARLKPGATVEQARQEVQTIALQNQRQQPQWYRTYGARVTPLRQYMFERLYTGMKVLLAGALFVLLIGCANIANLLLIRQAERQRELSLHLALGSGGRRLVLLVMMESLLLALAGGALGLLLARFGTAWLARMVQLPPYVTIELDAQVVTFAVAATLLTGVLFALPPALSVARMDSQGTLQRARALAGGRGYSSRSRNGLLIIQVAFVVVLLVSAGLLLRSFARLHATGVDFRTDQVLSMRLSFKTPTYASLASPNIARAERELLRRLQSTPGVEAAAIWGSGIPGVSAPYSDLRPAGASDSDPAVRASSHSVSAGALELLEIPLVRGRTITPQDTLDKPRVALVSQTLAQAMWPGQDPIGKRLQRFTWDAQAPWTVVGVVRDTRLVGPLWNGKEQILLPVEQWPTTDATLLVRTRGDADRLGGAVRATVRGVDPQVPLYDIASLGDRLREEEADHRLNAVVVTMFSLVALILAVVGLYGLLAYSVVQRTKEIGIRMALGAARQTVVAMVMKRALGLVGAGMVLGVAGALILAQLLSTVLFGVTARDPVTFAIACLLFVAVALVATYLPARQASRVEPTTALRFE